MKGKAIAIVAAAGRGRRLGGGQWKGLIPICGRPLVNWTVEMIARSQSISGIIVVAGGEAVDEFRIALEDVPKILEVVGGGESRFDSVKRGFDAIRSECELVVVHDCARPFVDAKLVDEVVAAAGKWGGAIAAVPVVPTIKRVGAKLFVEETIDRKALWEAQTPQAFAYSLLKSAYKSYGSTEDITDESLLAEKAGARVKIVMGSYCNMKITTLPDLKMAELMLKEKLRTK